MVKIFPYSSCVKALAASDNCFDVTEVYEGMFLPNYISKKKQIIPNIIDVLEKK